MASIGRTSGSACYFPILKWRHRELAALGHLDDADADRIVPIFELPPEQWNFDTGCPAEDIRLKYARFGISLSAAWKNRRCAIDSPYLTESPFDKNRHILDLVFEQARTWGCNAMPVFGLGSTEGYLRAVKRAHLIDGLGACLRLRVEDMHGSLEERVLDALLAAAMGSFNCDLIIDFGADAPSSVMQYVSEVTSAASRIPFLNKWRSVILARTSMPAALPHDLYWPRGDISRLEWSGYLAATRTLGSRGVRVSYADYGVAHPSAEMVDPRLIGRETSLVYARQHGWDVYAPQAGRESEIGLLAKTCSDDGLAQCGSANGQALSWADAQIRRLAFCGDADGTRTIWPQIATNRHLSVVARQLANQPSAMEHNISSCNLSG